MRDPDDVTDDPVRRAAQYRVDREIDRERAARTEPDDAAEAAPEEVQTPPRRRMDDRSRWVDTVVDQAIRRGEFDDLPLAGKPIPGLKGRYDPDWWLKSLVERDQITGVLPPAQLRQEDAALDEALDRESSEDRVREVVADFNARVIDARRQLMGGPPVLTQTRDVEKEVARWRDRRRQRLVTPSVEPVETTDRTVSTGGRRRWWRRRGTGS